jgi:hypothetical protein
VGRIVVHKLANLDVMRDKNRYQDYSLLQLDRPVQGGAPLVLDRTGEFLIAGNKVFLAGYPMGMSVKITDPDDAHGVRAPALRFHQLENAGWQTGDRPPLDDALQDEQMR